MVTTSELQQQVMREMSSRVISGYLGEQNMLGQLKKWFHWPSMSANISAKLALCVPPRSLLSKAAKLKYILVVGDYRLHRVNGSNAMADQGTHTVAVELVDAI